VSHQSIAGDTVLFYVGSVYAPGGFVWVFPRGDGSANVGLGFLGTFHTPGLSREYLLRFVARFFPGAVPSDIHCGGVPVGRWLKPLVRDGVMLVGDAARQVNCLNGAGIAYGMNAGRNAGETAARAFDGTGCDWNKLKQYEKTWASSLGRQQVRSYVLKKTLLTKNNDAFYDTVARSFAGADPENLDYTRIFLKAFARHPLLLVKVILLFR
jgi:digeranylgeranylglycerophospholipid reductase